MPETGIIDYKKVAAAYAEKIRDASGDIRLSQRVVGILDRPDEIVLQTRGGDYRTKYLINCCGLQSDIVAKMMGGRHSDGRRTPHHSVSRRVLQNRAGAPVPREEPDLSRSRSDLSLSGRALHAHGQRRCRSRPQRRIRLCARGLPPHRHQFAGSVAHGFIQGILGDHGKVLADRLRRTLPLAQQIGLRPRTAKIIAGNSRKRSRARRRRRARASRVRQAARWSTISSSSKAAIPFTSSTPPRPAPPHRLPSASRSAEMAEKNFDLKS